MLLRNAWYIGAWADEIGSEQPLPLRICNDPIVLFRDGMGRVAALADRCCHRAAPLHLGTVVEEGIQCGYHGLVINGSGRCVRVPGQQKIPDDARVRSYPVIEKDLTVGGNPAAHVDAEMKTTRTATGVKFTRWMKNSLPPPTYVKAAGFSGRVDRWQEFEFVSPSSVLQWTGAADAGTGAYEGNRDGGFQFRLFHGLTPETETSCFYFWSVANGYRQNEPEATEQLYHEIAPTFVEDRVMVEAQQTRLSEFGEEGLIDIASDATRMQMRRMVDRLIAEERIALAAE